MLINDAQITGSLTVNASSSFQNIIVSGNILPDTTNIRNLGSVDKYFKEIYVSTGSINFVDSGSVKSTITSAPGGGIQIGSVVITTSSIAFVDSTGSVTQNVAQSSSVGPISDYATSASFNSYTSSTNQVLSSLQTTSASVNISVSAINTFTSSTSARVSSIETVSASNLSRLGSIETFTSSTSARLNSIENVSSSNLSRLTSLENKTGSLATTGSNTFVGTQVITGSLYVTTDLIVQGSSSIQNITSSTVNIGTNKVILNTANPAVRYAGISVIDSGSTGLTGSILWDSTNNNWLYQNPSGSGYTSAKFIAGPQSQTLGSELGIVTNYIVKAVGDDHISSSAIYDDGTTISLKSNSEVTGSLKVTSTITATNLVGIWSGSAQLPAGIFSGSAQLPAGTVSGSSQISLSGFSTSNLSEGTNLYYTDARVKTKLNAETVISGSSQVINIANSQLTNSSFYVGTTSISLGRGSASQTLTGVSIDGNAATATSATSATSAASATNSTYINSHDLRTIAPNSHDAYKLRFGFTSFNNNNTSPWADYLHLRSYSDNSGGADNLLMFKKSGIGMRLWQQTFGSATAYSSYADILDSSNYSYAANMNQNVRTSDSPSFQEGTFGTTAGASDQGIQIRYQNYASGYGRIRFYQSDSNHMTIHAFSNSWQSGTLSGASSGGINIAGQNGVTFGGWNNVDGYISTGGTAWFRADVTAYSDARVKENIRPIENALEKIKKTNGVLFDRIDSGKKDNIGFIAQHLEKVFPELVFTDDDGLKSVKYQNMTAVLVEAIKEQQIKIDNLTLEIETLKKQKGL